MTVVIQDDAQSSYDAVPPDFSLSSVFPGVAYSLEQFEAFYADIVPKLEGYFRNKTSNYEDAQDLAIATMVRFEQALVRYGGDVKSWHGLCWKIARDVLFDHWRVRSKTQRQIELSEEHLPQQTGVARPVEDRVISHEVSELIAEAGARALSSDLDMLILAYMLNGETPLEIVEELQEAGLTVAAKTISNRMSNIRQKLKPVLERMLA